MSELKELLLPALRQYQHNDCSGLLFGYDKDEVESIVDNLREQLAKANERVEELECSVDKANEMLEEVRASGDLGLYMDNKLTAFLVGDSEQLRKEQSSD
ncbi:MAG: hypothetical protein Unbinned8596contig1000_19 [Prokaryotic dsDNA virus sp.]|nr:MAG: hypothetical protein Unbinned8596contig1000_19 [Prokaryotic dsDNA virus sp.]|tara:strand:- start:9964 stop:10263 length:300 start_codon:yes stop_codon:yes gene_type:complete